MKKRELELRVMALESTVKALTDEVVKLKRPPFFDYRPGRIEWAPPNPGQIEADAWFKDTLDDEEETILREAMWAELAADEAPDPEPEEPMDEESAEMFEHAMARRD